MKQKRAALKSDYDKITFALTFHFQVCKSRLKSDYDKITLSNSKYKVFKKRLLFKLILHLELTYKSFSLCILL
jgi:hypothetical protein